jgi:hypothetical protein
MMGTTDVRALVAVGLALAVALAGSLVALAARGGESDFLYAQRHLTALKPDDVERVVRLAPDPLTGTGKGTSASCRPRGSRRLRNPWRCTVSYRSGRHARLLVRVRYDGSYVGSYGGGGIAKGCCVRVPGGARR